MDTGLILVVFVLVYVGMALGRWPWLAIDRTGVAMVGAIVLFVAGEMDGPAIMRAIDFPTLAILFSLMVLSAQVAASRLFDRCGASIAASRASPRRVLLLTVLLTGGLAALLTNDVVVWAMTPVLMRGLVARGLDPRPFGIALACAANAGSAATMIGNPQNLLIGQVGELHFWSFFAVCGVPAAIALALVYGVTAMVWRRELEEGTRNAAAPAARTLRRRPLVKALVAVVCLIVIFTLPVDRATWTLAIAAALFWSRTMTTRRMLSMVDWHLLLLFAGLFVVTGALAGTGLPARLLEDAAALGLNLGDFAPLAALSLLGSNTVGNVPLVALLLSSAPDLGPASLYALALFSTLSGNLLVVGSIANIIVVERAREAGVSIGFADYARVGVPVTLASLIVSYLWLAVVL